jgi:hypothetical protein
MYSNYMKLNKANCQPNTTRNKITGKCEPTKNKYIFTPFRPSSPFRQSYHKTSNKKSRCKKGTRCNNRSGNHKPTKLI